MQASWNRSAISWCERFLLLLAVAYAAFHSLPKAWGSLITDFPNYYTAAQLAHEGYDTSRIYEWTWLQREKDDRPIDVRLIGLIPITPFSTLVMWPLTALPALIAKRVWIVFNLALLLLLWGMLRSLTGLSYQRIALVLALCFPLQRNLQFGQYYEFLLVLIVAACWLCIHEQPVLSGSLIGVAACCKIFPVLIIVLFVRRRNWRALTAAVVSVLACIGASVAVFGWNVHRTYFREALPWALHGEAMSPYVTSAASISSTLHYLLLAEPQWNPHPWHNSPLAYALLEPILQMVFLAPVILLIRRSDSTKQRIVLEWAALVTVSLAISTSPSSYHFVLMVFPVCALAALAIERKAYGWLTALAIAFLGIGFPLPSPSRPMGLAILLCIPRLPLMLAMVVGLCVVLWRGGRDKTTQWEWSRSAWAAAMVAATVFSVWSTLKMERAVRQEYAYRVPLRNDFLFAADPVSTASSMAYIAMMQDGYRLATDGNSDPAADGNSKSIDSSAGDDLSFSANASRLVVEKVQDGRSQIVDLRNPGKAVVDDAQSPVLSANGADLAFISSHRGRGRLMLRSSYESPQASTVALTPAEIDVYEATFLSPEVYAFSGSEKGSPPQIYLTDASHADVPIALGESRYPALSPDGRWMAYSHLDRGVWNLWVRDQATGATRRVADIPCDQIQASWESDSRTLDYATDCGRSFWMTAVSRRRVIP